MVTFIDPEKILSRIEHLFLLQAIKYEWIPASHDKNIHQEPSFLFSGDTLSPQCSGIWQEMARIWQEKLKA